jgi:hypothetical protein
VAILKNNELLSRGLCDEEGKTNLHFDDPFELASATLSISGHNKFRYEHQGIIFIDAPPVRDLTANVDETVITLEWKEPDFSNDNAPDYYAIYRDGSRIKTLLPDYLTYQDEDELSWNTNYEYCVRAFYSIHVSSPVCLTVKTEPYCDIVGKISSAVSGKAVAVQWKMPEPIAPEKYSVFRDGVFLMETTKLFIIDEVPEDDTEYEYCVVAQYDACDPEPVCLKVIVGSPDGITETQSELFKIYPNPANNYVTVVGSTMQRIEIYDITGRTICEININGASQTNISVSGLENGLYFLRIYNDDNVFVKRFTIIR